MSTLENAVSIREVVKTLMQSSPKPKQPIANKIAGVHTAADGLFCQLHTALRKLADSKITSAMWNALYVINENARQWLVNIVQKSISAKTYETDVELVNAVRIAFLGDEDGFGKYECMMLLCMFELFSHDDWCGFLGYIIIWPDEVKE